ncbi:MAG: hypothetical protein J5750_04430 [Clostridiales bacterium]|nr:hypothetical protein [Clostridiales bacterium]
MSDKVKNILIGFIGVLVLIGMFFVCVRIMQNSEKSYKGHYDELQAERTRVIGEARKLDPEEGKIVLTDDFLKIDYQIYYDGRQEGSSTFGKILLVFTFVAAGFCVISAISMILRARFRNEPLNILRLVCFIVPLIFIFVFYFVFRSAVNTMSNSGPKPEEAQYKVFMIDVTNKQTKVIHSSDNNGSDTTRYYIYYDNGKGGEYEMSVTSSMYDVVEHTGPYYLACAEQGSKKAYFAIYSPEAHKCES